MVVLKQQPFALPLANVVEIFHLDIRQTNLVDGQMTIIVREHAIPLFFLSNWLVSSIPASDTQKMKGHVVVVNVWNIQVGLVVDELIGQQQIVIKTLGKYLQQVPGISGSTIMTDGNVALILDVAGLVRLSNERS